MSTQYVIREEVPQIYPYDAEAMAQGLNGGTDQSPSDSTSHASSEQAKTDHSKRRRRSSTGQPPARKSRLPKKGQSVPDWDPRFKVPYGDELDGGERTAREYLVYQNK